MLENSSVMLAKYGKWQQLGNFCRPNQSQLEGVKSAYQFHSYAENDPKY